MYKHLNLINCVPIYIVLAFNFVMYQSLKDVIFLYIFIFPEKFDVLPFRNITNYDQFALKFTLDRL